MSLNFIIRWPLLFGIVRSGPPKSESFAGADCFLDAAGAVLAVCTFKHLIGSFPEPFGMLGIDDLPAYKYHK